MWLSPSHLELPILPPNQRLQAPRPARELLGGSDLTHHRAELAAIAVVGARLRRSVRRTEPLPGDLSG